MRSKSFEILKSVGVPIYVRKKEREEEKPTEGTEGGEPSSKRARTMTGGEEKEVEGDKASTAPGQAAIDTKAAVAAGGPGATTETAKGSSHMVAGGTAETDIAEDAAARTKSLSAEDGPAHLAEGKVRFFDVTRAAEGNGAYRESPLR